MRRIATTATILALPLFMAGCVGNTPDNVGPGDVQPNDDWGDDDGRLDDDSPGDDDFQQVDARVIAELPVMGASARLDNEPMDCEGMVCERDVTEARTYMLSATAPNRVFVEQTVEVTDACTDSGCAYDWYGEGMQCLSPNGFYVSEFEDYPEIETTVISGQVVVKGIGPARGVCTDNIFGSVERGFVGTIEEDLATITIDNYRDGVLDYTEVLTLME